MTRVRVHVLERLRKPLLHPFKTCLALASILFSTFRSGWTPELHKPQIAFLLGSIGRPLFFGAKLVPKHHDTPRPMTRFAITIHRLLLLIDLAECSEVGLRQTCPILR